MQAIYSCPIIGSGAEEDERRPYIANYPVKWSIYGQFPDEGTDCLVVVTASPERHAELQADELIKVYDGDVS